MAFRSTSRLSCRGSTPGRSPRRSSARSSSQPRPGARGAAGSWSTAPRRATTWPAWRLPTWATASSSSATCTRARSTASCWRGCHPTFVAPELDSELQIAHCLAPESLDRALAETPEAVAAQVVSPTYFGAVADVAALAEVAHSHGRPAGRRRGLGRPPRLPPGPARSRALARRGPGDLEHAQDRRQPHPVGDAPPRPRRPPGRGGDRPLRDARRVDQPELAARRIARRHAPARRGARPGAADRDAGGAGRHAGGGARDPGPRRARRAARRPPGRVRLRPAAALDRRARHGRHRLRDRAPAGRARRREPRAVRGERDRRRVRDGRARRRSRARGSWAALARTSWTGCRTERERSARTSRRRRRGASSP